MCGIIGSIPAIPEKQMKIALDTIAHRGPDGSGIWNNDWISLGHRRLAIIDLSNAGAQPMHYFHFSITFNGEIFNYIELKQELETLGHSFKTKSDTEVILAAYAEWGTMAFKRFNGMWALAIWDDKEKELIISRDRFGQKPLFYIHKNDRFVFASEMKALIPFLRKVELSHDFSWMKDHLFDYEPTEKCLIQEIKRFPYAHWGKFKNDQLTIAKYWDTIDNVHPVPEKYNDQVEAFREIFLDACKIRMRSDVSIGTALSGGMDSSATICNMSHIARNFPEHQFKNDWQHAFVASLPGTPLDETYYAKTVTDYLDIPATFIEIDPELGLANLPQYLFNLEELYITSPVPMMATYQAAREAGVFITLDGHGADELFCGYDTFLLHAFLDCGLNPVDIFNIIKTYRSLAPPGVQFVKPHVGVKNYKIWIDWKKKYRNFRTFLAGEIKTALLAPKPKWKKGIYPKTPKDLGWLNGALFDLFHTGNLPTLLRNYDRFSMAFGVEIRMPFLDYRVVNYCFSIPWKSKVRKGYTKSLLRDAMSPFMPKEIVKRKQKMGFQTPIVNWMKGPWKDFFLDLVSSVNFRNSSLVDTENVAKDINQVINQQDVTYRDGELAYAALSPYLWELFVLNRMKEMPKLSKEFLI